ncbi:hypothetical protein COCNU_03G011440 [Cocos nucifera]|uniref:Uncharacterized protein n=1 Tax=Cocos nucifera TaxID=13894 RepID=A0A8K0I395_COCNU|nr:hypothetical protein COCNU_03G011440 [Cocos nucifera]
MSSSCRLRRQLRPLHVPGLPSRLPRPPASSSSAFPPSTPTTSSAPSPTPTARPTPATSTTTIPRAVSPTPASSSTISRFEWCPLFLGQREENDDMIRSVNYASPPRESSSQWVRSGAAQFAEKQ